MFVRAADIISVSSNQLSPLIISNCVQGNPRLNLAFTATLFNHAPKIKLSTDDILQDLKENCKADTIWITGENKK